MQFEKNTWGASVAKILGQLMLVKDVNKRDKSNVKKRKEHRVQFEKKIGGESVIYYYFSVV